MVKLTSPFKNKDFESLKIGDQVLISGTIYTARDMAHKRMVEAIKNKEKLPFELKGQIIYYTGPTPAKPKQVIGSAGPTTAARMDPFTPQLLAKGLKGMIGKGYRSPEVKKAIKQRRAVYFVAIGGAGALLSKKIKKAKVIAYPDLGTEAVFKLEVEDFPVIVAVDSKGRDIFERE